MINYIRHLICICLICFVCPVIAQQQIKTEIQFSLDSINIGDQLSLQVNVTCDPNVQVIFPKFESEIVKGIEVLDFKLDTTKLSETSKLLEAKYLITSFDSGRIVLDSFPILIGKGTQIDTIYTTSALLLKVGSPTISEGFIPYDIKDIKKHPFPWLLYSLIGLFILGLMATAFWFFMIRKKRIKDLFVSPPPIVTPYEIALDRLLQLKNNPLYKNGLVVEYYSALSDIVRTYIERQSGYQAMEKTSDEILADLTSIGFTHPDQLRQLRDLFTYTDLVKFAKYDPGEADNLQNWERAYSFLERSNNLISIQSAINNELKTGE